MICACNLYYFAIVIVNFNMITNDILLVALCIFNIFLD